MRFAPLLIVLLLAAAGCGGDEETGERSSQRLSRPAAVPGGGPGVGLAGLSRRAGVAAQSQRKAADEAELARRHLRNDRARVPRSGVAPYLPLYRLAARHYGVPWLLLAAIHKQETAFSTAEGTYRGLNFANCCAGPMQFNLTNKPVSTWKRFGDAFRTGPARPARYPHRTKRHPSPYDDWDAILAAARLLAANGAGAELDLAAWSAAYLYYGPGNLDEDDYGVTYANEVLARAVGWERRGFCPGCATRIGLLRAVAAKYQPELKPSAEDEAREKRRKRRARARARRRREAREARRERTERRERRDRAEERRRKAAARERAREAEKEREPAKTTPDPAPRTQTQPPPQTQTTPAQPEAATRQEEQPAGQQQQSAPPSTTPAPVPEVPAPGAGQGS